MKIGIVSNLYPPYARGGAEQIARRIAQELTLRGHDVFAVSTRPFAGLDSMRTRMTERGVERVYRFYPINLYHILNDWKFPFPVRIFWHLVDLVSPLPGLRMRRIIRREEPDAIITHNLKGIGVGVARATQEAGVRHIHTLHDIQLSVPSGLMRRGEEDSWLNRSFLRRFYERLVRRAIGTPDVVLSPSKFLINFYRDRGIFTDTRVELLPNPAPKVAAYERKPYDPSVLRILVASQLEPHKGIRFLLETLEAFDRPWELHIAGEGSLAEFVSDLAERDARVTYHGFVSLENLARLFAISDVVAVPSLCYEGSPTIIYESLQAGIPVIAADIGGVGELVRDGENGLLVPSGDQDAWLAALTRLADGTDRFETKSDPIQATVAPYSIDRYADRLEELLTA